MGMKLYIDGTCAEGKGEMMEVRNPATGKVIGSFRGASVEQAEEALQSAKRANKSWSRTSLNERVSWIQKLKAELFRDKDEIIELLSAEGGRSDAESLVDFNILIETLDFYPEEAKRIYNTGLPSYGAHCDEAVTVIHRPIGVVVSHLAWNAPYFNAGNKLAPAMASGCPCILRPSAETPMATLKIGELCERIGLPAGAVNILSGPSRVIGTYLSASTIPAMVSLIGSTETGKQIIREASTSVKRYSLELGGNSPCILMPDCDIDATAKFVAVRKRKNAGQGCANINRIFVHESIHDEFVEKLVAEVQKIQVGWGKEYGSEVMGAQMTRSSRDRLLDMAAEAVQQGAKLLYGGTVPALPAHLQDGYFMMPTVLDCCTDDMRAAKEELFGPVFTILIFKDLDEVLERANDTEFGLASLLFTHDARTMLKCAQGLDFGMININGPSIDGANMPHCGVKNSGVGCVRSKWAMEEYYNIHRVGIKP